MSTQSLVLSKKLRLTIYKIKGKDTLLRLADFDESTFARKTIKLGVPPENVWVGTPPDRKTTFIFLTAVNDCVSHSAVLRFWLLPGASMNYR